MDAAVATRAMSAAHSSGVKAGSEGGVMFGAGVLVICVIGGAWLLMTMKSGADQKTQALEAQVQTKDATLEQIAARDARAAQQRNVGTYV